MWKFQDHDADNNFMMRSYIITVEIRLHLFQLQDFKFSRKVTRYKIVVLGCLKICLSAPEWLSLLDFGQGYFVMVVHRHTSISDLFFLIYSQISWKSDIESDGSKLRDKGYIHVLLILFKFIWLPHTIYIKMLNFL